MATVCAQVTPEHCRQVFQALCAIEVACGERFWTLVKAHNDANPNDWSNNILAIAELMELTGKSINPVVTAKAYDDHATSAEIQILRELAEEPARSSFAAWLIVNQLDRQVRQILHPRTWPHLDDRDSS